MDFRNRFYAFLPYLVFMVGVASSIILWDYFRRSNLERERDHLVLLGQEIRDVILNRIKTYEDAHYSGGALYHTIGDINGKTWKRWVKSTHIMELYPGIYGIGIAVYVDKKDSVEFLERARKDDPGFKIKRMNDLEYPDMFIIRHLEPMERNKAAYGYDMGTEINRRRAMETARRTGKSQITKIIKLVQDSTKSPGFLLYVPIYETDYVPPPHLRDSLFRGWIYSPFIASYFAEGMVKRELRNTLTYVSFDLFSDSLQNEASLFYSYRKPNEKSGKEIVKLSFPLYGQYWSLKVYPGERLRNQYITRQPLIILLTGIFLSMIMSGFVYLLANTHKKAIGIAQDMTHELNALNLSLEEKVKERTSLLKSRNLFYETLMQAMHEGILVLDKGYNILSANQRFRHMFDLHKELEGLKLTDLDHGSWDRVLKDATESLKKNELIENEYNFELKDGLQRFFSVTSIPLTRKEFSITLEAVLIVVSDVTDKVENEMRRNDFIGFVTHELRTPITNLQAFVQLSLRFQNNKQYEESLKLTTRIQEFIETLKNLVNELHDVTKISSGKLQVIKEEIDYDSFINEVVEATALSYPDHNFIVSGKCGLAVCADKFRLNQVLTNYLSNAVKYSPDSKEILINVKVDGDRIITSVKDFGPGIPEENKSRVFERLYRVQKHSKKEGLGLGLYLSREIIKAHGGKVWLESEENKGSEFFYCIPIGM